MCAASPSTRDLMLLALGLNVIVGWGGLLDLGFVAFFGVGAYTYAILSADRYDLHLPIFCHDSGRGRRRRHRRPARRVTFAPPSPATTWRS